MGSFRKKANLIYNLRYSRNPASRFTQICPVVGIQKQLDWMGKSEIGSTG